MLTVGKVDGAALTLDELDAVRETLKGHSYVEAFPGTFVVTLVYDEERKEIIDALSEVAEARAPKAFAILVSPRIEAGRTYNGWLIEGVWDEINRRTKGISGSSR